MKCTLFTFYHTYKQYLIFQNVLYRMSIIDSKTDQIKSEKVNVFCSSKHEQMFCVRMYGSIKDLE